jgi:glycosyltransferase involved in cell wall biosynthesis
VPAIHTFHGIHYERYSRAGQALYLALERRLSRLTHTVINVSMSQEAQGLRLGLFTPARSVVIVNGIDVAELDHTVARAPIERRDLGLAADDLVLGCVARFDPVKGLDVLLRAVSSLVPQYPQLKLVLVGDGSEAAKLRRLSEALDLSSRVVFTGAVEEAPRIFPAWHVYVSPSRKEGLPLALLEAMACQLPVVATRIPGHLDTVVAGETGLLAEPDDPKGLATAIARLLDDPELRKRMGRAARNRVEANFTIERMTSQIAGVYRQASAPS